MSLETLMFSINLAALILLLLHLLGIRLAPDPYELDPFALPDGGKLPRQAFAAWITKQNADREWAYWSGVRSNG